MKNKEEKKLKKKQQNIKIINQSIIKNKENIINQASSTVLIKKSMLENTEKNTLKKQKQKNIVNKELVFAIILSL